MYKRVFIIGLIGICMLFVTGCWDRVEIEKNAFILGLGIDYDKGDNQLIVTYQIALLDAFKGEEGEKSKSTQQISIKSDSLTTATNSLLLYFGDVPNFAHCKLIIFGDEYAKKGIKDSLDYLFRETKIRRITSVCVAQGRAKEILEIEPETAPSSAMVIGDIITQNSKINSEIFPFHDVGYLHQNFIRGSDITLAKVLPKKGIIEVSGAGLFKDYQLVGWYTGNEVTGQRFILGEIDKGLITIHLPWDKGGRIIINAYNINAVTTPVIVNNNIKIKTKILVEGDINEIENSTAISGSEGLLKYWQEVAKEQIDSMVHAVYKKGRDTYSTDSFQIDEKVENYFPSFWKKNRDRWDEILKTIDLDLDVDVKIRRLGIIKP